MSRNVIIAALVLSLLGLFLVSAKAEETQDPEIKLKYAKLDKIDKIFTPGRKKKQLTLSIDLPNGIGRGIACDVESHKITIDTNLDGKPDKGVVKNGQIVELMIQNGEDAKKTKYAVYITHIGNAWYYETASAVKGTLGGTKICIIDDNCNGKFADYGEDGLLMGADMSGWYLSSAISLGDVLYEVDVDPSGAGLSYREFVGELGTIDPLKKLKDADFKPIVFVVKQEDRSFNILREGKKQVGVPIGRYTIERGVINNLTEFIGAKHPPFEVLAGNTTVVEWGGPFTMLFNEAPSDQYPAMIYGTTASHPILKGGDSDPHKFYLEPPYIVGEKGEVYVGTEKWCRPESPLSRPTGQGVQQLNPYPPARISFNIEILDRKTKKAINKDKPTFYTGNQPAEDENTPAKYFWFPYTYSYGDYRGNYILRVTTTATQIFKDAVYEKVIELK